MAAYFDDALHKSLELQHVSGQDDDYIAAMAAVEQPVVIDTMANALDREFPEDLRQRVLHVTATRAVFSRIKQLPPPRTARLYALTMHYSAAIEELHGIFLTLSARAIYTRFGRWTASPSDNLSAIRAHDREIP